MPHLLQSMVAPHLTGLGGGGTMLIHRHRQNKTTVVDFREAAPTRPARK
jgi:gamma-glutamyltranspeptidase/glutathione hydrolase